MQITYLADHPDFIPTLAQWHQAQFGYLSPQTTVEQRAERLQAHLGGKGIPTTFVALVGGRLAGSASLIAEDMSSRPDLSPWLASLYVDPAHRKRGLGTALVRQVVQEAQGLGIATLYLYTPDQEAFYARRGWSTMEHALYRGYWVTVMSFDILPKEGEAE
jgi:GNAT superfamily N-acetyltransferase